MRVLIVGVNYTPEISGIAPYTTAMAEGLQKSGHTVRVIAGVPHYPQWKNFTRFTGLRREEVIRNVSVRRVRHYIGNGGTGFGRVVQELTFGLGAVVQDWEDAEVVVCVSPALLASALAVLKARLTGRPIGVWVQDLYANGAREISDRVGVMPKVLRLIESRTLRSSAGVLVIHARFRQAVVEGLGVHQERVTVSRNWSHLGDVSGSDPAILRARFFNNAPVVAIHTGNMGAKQALENVVEAAKIAAARKSRVTFGLVGDGSQRELLQRAGEGVDRLVFVPSLSDEDYAAVLRSADIFIVNEKAGLRASAVPSKLTSYFTHGKPVVAATEEDSATADEVAAAEAGVVVPPGKPEALLEAVERMAQDQKAAAAYSIGALRFAANNLTAESAINRVEAWLERLRVPR